LSVSVRGPKLVVAVATTGWTAEENSDLHVSRQAGQQADIGSPDMVKSANYRTIETPSTLPGLVMRCQVLASVLGVFCNLSTSPTWSE
jgi:hypothetical protein